MELRRKMLGLIARVGKQFCSLFNTDDKIWVFGAWKGQLYSDNSKYLFQYILENHPEIHPIWITRNNKVLFELRKNGLPVQKRFSLNGFYSIVKAGFAFETEGDQDISPFMNKKTKVIQLWHGVAPKKANWNGFNQDGDRRRTNYWMASSEQNKGTLQELFGMSSNHIYVTGYPRNDTFVKPHVQHPVIQELNQKYSNYKKVIYMPTHRNFGSEGMAFSKETMFALDKKLRERDIVMVYKPHFHELQNYLDIENEFTNIVLAKDQEKYQDVYGYICDFDLLISDYSSIIYDFLCAKKPIVLFPYDLEHFRTSDAGLFDYYEGYPAGPFCFDWDQVVEQMMKLLDNDHEWEEKRETCRRLFHPFDDGNNCERVYEAAVSLVGKKL